MRLVRGRNLREIFDRVKEGDEGWSQTRALGVLLRVCEAMGYAHSKGVIHRDLKPGNVMVGRFGEVYVMDWGLARVIGREDTKDPQLRPAAPKTVQIDTARAREREVDPLTPLVTTGGRILGTPSYMPPEQARGEVDKLDRRSDVYAIGAMLYHLLAGEAPYVPRGMRVSGHTIWKWVLDGPPKPLREPNPNVPPELEAICEKAMAREQDGRYADTMELAEDLRAYLEHGVVKAYESGALAVFRKWVERSRMAAAAIAQERDFDELCRSNPELQGELRRLRAFWHKMAGRMRWHGVQPDLLPGVALNLPREEPDEPERVYRPLSRGERTVIRELISVTMAPGSPRPEEPERSGVPSHRRYEILRPMAEGGAGTVYMAWDRQLRRHVALKSLRGSDPDKGRIRRFLQGALIPARLHHPGILPVFDGGLDEEGRPFLAMPYVRGVSLREAIREVHEARGGSSWTLRRGVEVLADVCDAVAYAHSRGVIHRDLKPSNILVDPFGAAYVFDWGLAKIVGPREKGEEEESAEEATSGLTETVEGQVFGTPAYMAPEAALGRTDLIDARTDVYGLGAILFELLTGSYPWSHVRPESAAQLLKLILSGPPVSLRALAPQVPAPLAAICEKAMARARESRYSSAAELGADLRAWLEGRAARAYDSGPLARALAWGRRNRGMAAVLGAFVVILVRWATLEFGD
jgi:serine/threonine protein kinase